MFSYFQIHRQIIKHINNFNKANRTEIKSKIRFSQISINGFYFIQFNILFLSITQHQASRHFYRFSSSSFLLFYFILNSEKLQSIKKINKRTKLFCKSQIHFSYFYKSSVFMGDQLTIKYV